MYLSNMVITALAVSTCLSLPTLVNLTALIEPRADSYGWIANYEDDQCKGSQSSQIYFESAHCIPLDYNMDTVGINWGTEGQSINCGINVFIDENCKEYASVAWQKEDGNCRNMRMDGGPWRSVKVGPCWGPGAPNGGDGHRGIRL